MVVTQMATGLPNAQTSDGRWAGAKSVLHPGERAGTGAGNTNGTIAAKLSGDNAAAVLTAPFRATSWTPGNDRAGAPNDA
jgi:hypothetical protein